MPSPGANCIVICTLRICNKKTFLIYASIFKVVDFLIPLPGLNTLFGGKARVGMYNFLQQMGLFKY